MCRTVIISRSAWIVRGSDVLFSGQLIVLQFDKESPRYTYEEPALHMTGNAVADSVSIHPTTPVEFLRMYDNFSQSCIRRLSKYQVRIIFHAYARGTSA